MANWLGFTDDEGASGASGYGLLGPMTANQKSGLLFAGLRDVVGRLSGEESNHLDQQSNAIEIAQDRVRRQRAIDEALRKGDVVTARRLETMPEYYSSSGPGSRG